MESYHIIVCSEINIQALLLLTPAPLQTSSLSSHDHQPEAETQTSLLESEKYQVKLWMLSFFSIFLFSS